MIMNGPDARGPEDHEPQRYSTVTFAAIATDFQVAMSLRMKAAKTSGLLPIVLHWLLLPISLRWRLRHRARLALG